MSDRECIELLQWALPRLHLRWRGFRKVRRQVCRRIERRRAELGLADLAAYRAVLESSPDEWYVLDELCRVTISRFARDRAIWSYLAADVLPRLAASARRDRRPSVRAWSAGCGAGEEPFTLAIAWELAVAPSYPDIALDVFATDIDRVQLGRAAAAIFPPGALRELPEDWHRVAFEPVDGEQRVRDRFRSRVRFARHDVRGTPPDGPFDLILCRNLAFTYFDDDVQRCVADAFHAALRSGGALVVGIHEQLPAEIVGFARVARCCYRRASKSYVHPAHEPT